jgi:hypothetical protein
MYALSDISNQMLEDSAFDMEGEIRGEATGQFAVPPFYNSVRHRLVLNEAAQGGEHDGLDDPGRWSGERAPHAGGGGTAAEQRGARDGAPGVDPFRA